MELPEYRGAATSCLTRDEEERLTRELQEARKSYAEFLLRLPNEWREYLLEDDPDGPKLGEKWPLSKLDASFDRLLTCTGAPEGRPIEETLRRARHIKRRIDRVRERLILANLALVRFLAAKNVGRGVPYPDLVQEGTIGLIEAVERYDPERKGRLASYAQWWIRKKLIEAFSNGLRLIRLPQPVHEELRRVTLAAEELGQSLGRKPTDGELASRTQLSEAAVRRLSSIGRDPQSLDGAERSIDSLGLPSCSSDSEPLDRMIQGQLQEHVIRSLGALKPRERWIVRLRFGIGGEQPQTLGQVAQVYGVSRERVRQIESEALNKLRRQLRSQRRSLHTAASRERS